MATVAGQVISELIVTVIDDNSIPDANVADYSVKAVVIQPLDDASFTDVPATPPFINTVPGQVSPDFADLWYGYFHILPNRVDVGNLTSQQIRSVELFNGYFTAQNITAIAATDLSGVSFDVTAPLAFAPLESKIKNLEIATVGDPAFDGFFEITVDDLLGTYYLYVTGKRVLVMPFQHNWTDRIVERLTWYNGYVKSLNGIPQVVNHRKYPRRTLDYQFLFASSQSNAYRLRALFRGLMQGWQSRVFIVPIWTDATRLPVEATAGTDVIDVSTTYFDYDVGSYVMLWQDEENYEVLEIAAVSAGQIQTTVNLSRTWSARRTVVMPAKLGYISQNIQGSSHTVDVDVAPVSFELLPQYKSLNRLVAASMPTYRGLPVIIAKNNFKPTVGFEIESRVHRNDNNTGIFSLEAVQPTPDGGTEFNYLFANHQEIAAFYDFLQGRRGRFGAFWLPTWAHDMNVIQAIGAADTTMLIDSIGYSSLYYVDGAPAYNRRDLMIRLKDGTRFFRRITGVSIDPDLPEETVTFDTALGQIVNPSDIDRVSFLVPSALKADAVEIGWESGNVSQSQILVADLYDPNI